MVKAQEQRKLDIIVQVFRTDLMDWKTLISAADS